MQSNALLTDFTRDCPFFGLFRTGIQSDVQLIRDSSLIYKVEYPLYIYLDRLTGRISCIRERPGTNTQSPVEVIPSPRYGVTYPKIGSTPPDNRILIAQNLDIGETRGTKTMPGHTIDIALDALRIWGKSRTPDFIAMSLWNKNIDRYSAKRM